MRHCTISIVITIVTLAQVPDADAAVLYWSDPDARVIQRNSDGGSPVTILSSVNGLVEPRGIAVDAGAGKIYFADNGTKAIRRANLDGSQLETLISTGFTFPSDLELDLSNGHIYWADRDAG